jgi:DNA-binding transcriptional MerR regulator/effector-binding domain-containing protein
MLPHRPSALPGAARHAYPARMDKDGLISIGRFARLTDLSPRFLRKLDERGLLSPVYVDPDSRYRYYSPGQTRLAGLVHLARQLGMTIDQLDQVVGAYDSGELRPYLERQRASVEARMAGDTRLLRLLELELERGGRPLVYEVALKDQPALLVMSGSGSVRRTHPHDAWALEAALRRVGTLVGTHLARHGQTPARHPVILYDTDLSRDETFAFEVCFPVAAPVPETADVVCRELPAARVAFTTFMGPYDTIWNAHVELQAWVIEHGYQATGPLREKAIVGEEDDADPRAWVTELSVPVGEPSSA